MAMPKRLFFALWPDVDTRQRLDAFNQSLSHKGRRLRADNLHVTLLFIGNLDCQWLDTLQQAAATVTAAPVQLQFNELDCWQKPQILCLTCQRQPLALYQLVNRLNVAMAGLPINYETRPFRAHITLARKVTELPEHSVFTSFDLRFDDFVLVESVSTASGVDYQVIQRWPLTESDSG